ncbi:MAG: hypothetical protein ACRC91_04755 [Aeromonas sp.]
MKKILISALSLMLTACAATPVTAESNPVARLAVYQVCSFVHAVNNDRDLLTSTAINQDAHIRKHKLKNEKLIEAGSISFSFIKTIDELNDEEYNRLELTCYRLAR